MNVATPPLPCPGPSVAPPLSVGDCAVLACVWEATAAKPGNVYRGADFEDVGFPDFLTSACAIRPALEAAAASGVGAAILAATQATRAAVGVNTNLGMVLLLAPLAAARLPLAEGVAEVLARLSRDDARLAYAAIRCASPGGLGSAPAADVRDTETPACTLLEAMRMAADRDVVARQYAENYAEVWRTADQIAAAYAEGAALERAIVDAHVDLLAARPDTLIVRKCGAELGAEASARAAAAVDARRAGAEAYHAALADFDFWLRSDGHRRNPGATADIVAAALFALLRGDRLTWPVRFSARPAAERPASRPRRRATSRPPNTCSEELNRSMYEKFQVRLAKERLVFSAAHFITYGDDVCEPLHGHNYHVSAQIEGPLEKNSYVVDFIFVRDALQELVAELDHRMLLPLQHPTIRVATQEGPQSPEVLVEHGARRWIFPASDCVLLPMANTTAEMLARYLATRLLERLTAELAMAPARLRVEVDECDGQWGVYELSTTDI